MEIVFYLGISHALFGIALLMSKRPKHISNFILAIWIFFLGLLMAGRLSPVPIVTYFKPGLFPIFLVFGPFLHLYIKSLTIEQYRFTRKEWLHFVPFLLVIAHRSITEPVNVGPGGGIDFREESQVINFIYFTLATASITVYTVIAFKQIQRHRHNLKNIYSFYSSRYTLAWLRIIAVLFLLIFTFSVVGAYLSVIFNRSLMSLNLQETGSMVFIVLASFFGVQQPIILAEDQAVEKIKDDSSTKEDLNTKYSRSGLEKDEMKQIAARVDDYIRKNKSYLDPEYSINVLAQELQIPRHHITQSINGVLEKNFYTLINEYRVQEVISRMNDQQYEMYTLLAIALDAGFNSKSAFNRIFKQITGKTPSEYKTENAG